MDAALQSRNVLSHCMLIGHHKVIRQSMPVVNQS